MRTLRIPTNRSDITPELLADYAANLRKLSNLSGTGCTVDELPNGLAINVPPGLQVCRVKLTTDWYACDFADSTRWTLAGNKPADTGEYVLCGDPFGMVLWDLAAQEDDGGALYIPAGYFCEVWKPKDTVDGHWELLHAGQDCVEMSEESELSEESEQSEESEESEESEGSHEPPSEESGGSEGSGESEGSGGPSEGSGGGGGGNDCNECPTPLQCESCPDEITLKLSSDCLTVDHTITLTRNDCLWTGSDSQDVDGDNPCGGNITAALACGDCGQWSLVVELDSVGGACCDCHFASDPRPSAGKCPPTGTWQMNTVGDCCCGGLTAVTRRP